MTDREIIANLERENDELARVLRLVEKWWIEEGKEAFSGAPYCIFKVREICGKTFFAPAHELETN